MSEIDEFYQMAAAYRRASERSGQVDSAAGALAVAGRVIERLQKQLAEANTVRADPLAQVLMHLRPGEDALLSRGLVVGGYTVQLTRVDPMHDESAWLRSSAMLTESDVALANFPIGMATLAALQRELDAAH